MAQTYEEFVAKFKAKKTTDDCYTPPEVYAAVEKWVRQEYGLTDEFTRPFYPGGDYQSEDYRGKVVVDNPPFSIISQIVDFYMAQGVKFFLFAPHLTLGGLTKQKGTTAVITDARVTYENGALVDTSFVTNLEPGTKIRTAPALLNAIKAAQKRKKEEREQKPKIRWPDDLATAALLGKIARVEYRVADEDATFVRKCGGRQIFGAGWRLSEKAAAEKAAAEKAAAIVLNWLPSEGEKPAENGCLF